MNTDIYAQKDNILHITNIYFFPKYVKNEASDLRHKCTFWLHVLCHTTDTYWKIHIQYCTDFLLNLAVKLYDRYTCMMLIWAKCILHPVTSPCCVGIYFLFKRISWQTVQPSVEPDVPSGYSFLIACDAYTAGELRCSTLLCGIFRIFVLLKIITV